MPEFVTNESVVAKISGIEYEELQKILIGIDDVIKRYNIKDKDKGKQREGVFIRNFKREIKPTYIVYAQFGSSHLFLNYTFNNHDVLMTAIEKDTKYTGRILNIYIHCERCELGESLTAYRPYALIEDTKRGYWWHDWLGDFTEEEHKVLINLLDHKHSVNNLRDTQTRLSGLSKLYQILVVLF